MQEIRTLTAMRGLAALWVVLFHYQHHISGRVPGMALISQGALAVDLFFTLSGFILVYVYRDREDIRRFFLKRFARLYPVHLVTLCAVVLLAVCARSFGLAVDESLEPRQILAHVFLLHAAGVVDRLALNYPSWSISAEAFAYLAYPVLAVLVLRQRLWIAVAGALALFWTSAALSELAGTPLTSRSCDLAIVRILPEFVMGMVAARIGLEASPRRILVALAALGLALTGLILQDPLIFAQAAPVVILALFLYDGPVPRPLRYLGLISYSLYMTHALTEKVGFTLLELLCGAETLPLWALALMTALAVAVAALTYHLVEEPGRKLVMRLGSAWMPDKRPQRQGRARTDAPGPPASGS